MYRSILDLLDGAELMGFVRALEPDATNLWPTLFPYEGTDDMTAEYFRGANDLPVLMSATGFESEAEMGSRGSFTKEQLELIKFARKMRLNEQEIRKTLQPRSGTSDVDAAINQIYDDATTLFKAADVTREKMAMDAITTGKITLRGLECDFQIPVANQDTLSGGALWSAAETRDPLGDELGWINTMVDAGLPEPARVLTSRKILNLLLQDVKYREAYYGKPIGAVAPPALTKEQFNQVRASQGLPPIRTYDRQARVQNEDGTYTTFRLMADDKYILLPDGALGKFLHGVPTEAMFNNDLKGSEKQGIYTYNYSEHEPPAIFTKTIMLAFPTFPAADKIFQATVL